MARFDWNELWINKPHATNEFKERAGFPPSFSDDEAHDVLKQLIVEAFERDQEKLENVRNTDKEDKRPSFCFRIHPHGRQVVYASVSYGHPEGRYTYMVHTVLSQDMYQSWSREGKLGTLADKAGESLTGIRDQLRKQTAETKEATKMAEKTAEPLDYYLYHTDTKMFVALAADQVDAYVTDLFHQGATLKMIQLYKRVPINIKINIGGE
jgi:hypothetical protein